MDIKDAQKLMEDIYRERDAERGTKATYMWLTEEMGEVARAILRGDDNVSEEMADLIAWILSLANLLGVDCEEAFLEKYEKGCPRCDRIHCRCA